MGVQDSPKAQGLDVVAWQARHGPRGTFGGTKNEKKYFCCCCYLTSIQSLPKVLFFIGGTLEKKGFFLFVEKTTFLLLSNYLSLIFLT